mgnify:CR=1 FL=1
MDTKEHSSLLDGIESPAQLNKFSDAQLAQLARGVATYGAMPRNLNSHQREAVLILARRMNPSL